MGQINSRQELKEWVVRKLGFPTISINVDDAQLEDRIDDSINFVQEWHFDGSELTYLKHQMQPSVMELTLAFPVNTFKSGETIIGMDSGTRATIWKQIDATHIQFYLTTNATATVSSDFAQFILGEDVQSTSGTIATIDLNDDSLVLGDFEKRYLDIPNSVLSISRIFPIQMNSSAYFLFDGQYYLLFDVLYNFKSADLVTYELTKEYINLIQQMLIGQKPIRYNRHSGKLYIDFNWQKAVQPGDYLIVECYRVIDPTQYPHFWNNIFLKEYTHALVKLQWAQNLGKFSNISLLGGVVLDAAKMLDDAKTEKDALEEKMKKNWSSPLGFFIG